MKETLKSDRLIISYLLGELPAEEQAEIEQRYFSEPDFLEQILAVEDDLIDAYLRNGLTPNERTRFEGHFLASADRREKVEAAEALLKYLNESNIRNSTPAEVNSWKQSLSRFLRAEGLTARLVFASLLVLAVFAGVSVFIENRRLRAPLDQAQVEKSQDRQQRVPEQESTTPEARNNQVAQETQPEKPPSETSKPKPSRNTRSVSVPVIATFVLTPGLTRDASGVNQLVIPHSARFIQLQLSVDSSENYKIYHATLQRVGGAVIWNKTIKNKQLGRASKPATFKSITLRLPAKLLSNGEYLLTVSGRTAAGEPEIAGDYPFTVTGEK